MSTDFLPHYTPDDIQAVKNISVWAAATCRSTTALAQMIGGSQGTLRAVLRGTYKHPPSPILARLLRTAGQRQPAGWDALLPAAEPDPEPMPAPAGSAIRAALAAYRPPMKAWEPGATLAAEQAERVAILKALSKSCSQAPMPEADLLTRVGDTPRVKGALEALIAAREVMQAVVIHGRKRQTVLYPVGRLPVPRPGPKAGTKKAKGRGAAISIPPSTRAGGGKGSPQP